MRILAPYVLSNSLLFHDIPVSFDSREYPYDTKNITILLEDFKTGEEDLSYSTDFVKKYDFEHIALSFPWNGMKTTKKYMRTWQRNRYSGSANQRIHERRGEKNEQRQIFL